MPHYDVIVIGVGGVGTAALYHLARRQARAIGLDRFPPGHDRGSSHGQTRIIRLAYYEHSDYVPLLRRAYELWDELEQMSGQPLFRKAGLLMAGPPAGEMMTGVLHAAKEHNLPLERLSTVEASQQFPGFRMPDDFTALFERQAGYLMVEDCVRAHANAANKAGGALHSGVEVRGWKVDGSTVIVETDQGALSADRLVITAGAWANHLLYSLNVPFTVLRKPLFWYRTIDDSYRVDSGCPCYMFETMDGLFYGFPQLDEQGVKVAEHTGGDCVENAFDVDRALRPSDQTRVEAFARQHLPAVSNECTAHAVCMYTMSPDSHFVVGTHPEHPQVVFTAGLSGHGFKFTSVLGEIMAELALEGMTRHPVGFLSHTRCNA